MPKTTFRTKICGFSGLSGASKNWEFFFATVEATSNLICNFGSGSKVSKLVQGIEHWKYENIYGYVGSI